MPAPASDSLAAKADEMDDQIVRQILCTVEGNAQLSQRQLSSELGIALGLINKYLKRCITKGWIRVSHVSPRRIGYFLTPEGLAEKSEMVAGYLSRSLTFFRDARAQCDDVIGLCASRQWNRLALLGEGDLADIATLVSHGTSVQVQVISVPDIMRVKKETASQLLVEYDALFITDVTNPQNIYNHISAHVPRDKLLTIPLLYISTSKEAA